MPFNKPCWDHSSVCAPLSMIEDKPNKYHHARNVFHYSSFVKLPLLHCTLKPKRDHFLIYLTSISLAFTTVLRQVTPVPYSGVTEDCSNFLLHRLLQLEMQSQCFPTVWAKHVFVVSLLSGSALKLNYLKPEWPGHPITHPPGNLNNCTICQGNSSITDYALHFWTFAAASGWNELTFLITYHWPWSPLSGFISPPTMMLWAGEINLTVFHLCFPSQGSHQLASPTVTYNDVWLGQLYRHVPRLHEWGIPGVSSLLQHHHLYRWYPWLLQEQGSEKCYHVTP